MRLESPSAVYACKKCATHLCDERDVVSRQFHGKHGQAVLVTRCENCYFGASEQKMLLTGLHIVRDIYCRVCDSDLGWTYDFAHEERERYKISKFVIETALFKVLPPPSASPSAVA